MEIYKPKNNIPEDKKWSDFCCPLITKKDIEKYYEIVEKIDNMGNINLADFKLEYAVLSLDNDNINFIGDYYNV